MVDVEVTANTDQHDQESHNTPFAIRRARAGADMQAVGKLWQQLVEYHNALDVQLPNAAEGGAGRYAARVESHLHDSGACVLVAEQDGQVVGFVLGVIVDLAPEMFRQERSGFLADIFVEEKVRRAGVGRALVHALADWFRQHNVLYYEWHVAAQNPDALAFWQSVGGQPLMIRMRAALDPAGENGR